MRDFDAGVVLGLAAGAILTLVVVGLIVRFC
jgi:hypothetical protein